MALIKRLGCSKLTEISMVGQRRTASSPSSFIVALACLYDMCMHVLCTPCDIYIIRHCIYIYTLLGPTKAFAPLLQHQVSQTCGWQHPHGRCQRMECPLAKKTWLPLTTIARVLIPNPEARVILDWLADFVPNYVVNSGKQQREWILLKGLLYFAMINILPFIL